MDGLDLLQRAGDAGVRVEADGDRLIVRGPRSVQGLVKQLIAHKPDVLAALGRRGASDAAEEVPLDERDAEEWMRGMREEFAPIRYLIPAGCFCRTVCSRLGPCDRHVGGRPCRDERGGATPSPAGATETRWSENPTPYCCAATGPSSRRQPRPDDPKERR